MCLPCYFYTEIMSMRLRPRPGKCTCRGRIKPTAFKAAADALDTYTRESRLRDFLDAAQNDRRRQEEHTADPEYAVLMYQCAARQKLREILGDESGFNLRMSAAAVAAADSDKDKYKM
ncbi:hypothetical protein B0T17DRAFT_522093 [Bombardia bombarda]|uniref:Uncharacterized protein n=1 Tax=Bombardia bombarda TaxID=252184 RepID=A0AA39X6T8_9PEZI|nr:hypothetical protein B0T17DRAFT_522093 [Bombardia bombarda]